MTEERVATKRLAERGCSGSRAPVALAFALLLGGCLVTGAADFEAVDNPTYLMALQPREPVVRLPASPESCGDPGGARGIVFEVLVSDEDAEQPLYFTLFRNGDPQGGVAPVSAEPFGPGQRRIRTCLPAAEIEESPERCHRVALMVSSDVIIAQRAPSPDQLNVGSTAMFWLVLNSGLNDPYVSASDCAPPLPLDDAGVAP
jgi:hypothetical protein